MNQDTPCVGFCVMDPRIGRCMGCARTLDEIAAWPAMSREQRLAVMKELPARTADAAPYAADPHDPKD